MTTSFEEIRKHAFKKWYQYGLKSPMILFKRLENGHLDLFHPFRYYTHCKQRITRGYSDRDTWSFDTYLTDVIRGGIRQLRNETHGHPTDVTHGEWMKILTEIEDGMWAAKRIHDPYDPKYYQSDKYKEDMAEFRHAMKLLRKWWFNLWD